MAARTVKRNARMISIFLLLAILMLLLPVQTASAQGPTEDSMIWGHVFHQVHGTPVKNITIEVDRDYYIGNTTLTDPNGYYQMNIPSGEFILRIHNEKDNIIYRLDFNISQDENKRLDFELNPDDDKKSKIYGTVKHKYTLSPMSDLEVYLYDGDTGSVVEDVKVIDGDFEIWAPAGSYRLKVFDGNDKIFDTGKSFDINFSQEKKFELTLESPKSLLTPDNVIRILTEKWIQIVFIIVTVVIGLLLLAYIDRIFTMAMDVVQKKPRRFVDRDILHFSERVVKWNIVILMLIIMAFLTAQILDILTTLWIPVRNSIASIYTIILLVVFMRITLMIWKQFVTYMRGGHHHEKPKKMLSPRMVTFIEIIGKYLIAFLYLLAIVLTGLAALGMSDLIVGGFLDGLSSNAGFIIFIVTLLILAYVVVRFMTSFFQDMKGKTKRFRPEMVEIVSKGVKYFIYSIIGMIIIFTLLSAAGMGEIGQTIIIVFSMIIGLVLSMAATGSIGNMLSGLVIMSFKPFDEGDWVTIADKYQGEIIETNLMFTKLRDLEDELVEIPNNMILSQGIVNWTTAAKRGGFAVEIDVSIGYDAPAKQVMDLMVRSCEEVTGLMKTKKPHVVLTKFLDHAIGYKLRAYIDTPHHRYKIKTAIMVNMQKTFTEEGVEILSPIFEVGRLERIPSSEEVKARAKHLRSFE